MPIDETIVEEGVMENTEITPDNSGVNSSDSPDTEIIDDSLVQEEEEMGSDSSVGEEEPETSPDEELDILPEEILEETEEEILETDSGDFFFNGEEEISSYVLENVEVYTDLDAFESSTIQVDLYQYTILNRLEFIQYALCIVIALLFLQIFVRYKK